MACLKATHVATISNEATGLINKDAPGWRIFVFGRSLSVITTLHFAGGFGQFDFGEKNNMEKYGQATPPQYNLSLVTSPVALYYSDNDRLSPVQVRQVWLHFADLQFVTAR